MNVAYPALNASVISEREEIDVLREMLLDQVERTMKVGESGYVYSGFVRSQAEVLRYLGRVGLIQISNDNGDRLVEGLLLRTG